MTATTSSSCHHVAHARNRAGGRLVDPHQLAAMHRACGDGADLHAGNLDVHAVDGGPVDLRRRVQPARRSADQLELRRGLQGDSRGHRLLRGVVREVAIAERLTSRAMHHAARGAAGGRIDLPLGGRRGDQHHACGGTGLAQGLPAAAGGGGAAGCLLTQQGVGVELEVGRRGLDHDLVHADFEFFGEQCRGAGIDALAAFGVAHDEGDRALRIDADEGVRLEIPVEIRRRHRRGACHDLGGAGRGAEAQTDEQSAAGGEARLQQTAARKPVGRHGVHLTPPPRRGSLPGYGHRCRTGRYSLPSRHRYRRQSVSVSRRARRSRP